MRTSITLWLVVAATVVGGLFGSLLDRALVATMRGGTWVCKRGPTTVATPISVPAISSTPSGESCGGH